MSHAVPKLALSVLLVSVATLGRAAEDQDRYEEQTVARCAERVARAQKSDRGHWIKELEGAFPGKVTHAVTEEEYATWFALLANKNDEWRRDDAASPAVAELFDRVLQRLELGPVPTIKRDEFARYAKRLMRDNPQGENAPNPVEDADKVFRVLDRDGNGELENAELTAGLKDDKLRTDSDGNGRITKEEYRGYFERKVVTKAETFGNKGEGRDRNPDGKGTKGAAPGNGLPDWFRTLDSNKDAQISLFEWRQGKRAIAAFEEMDLNADGLVTKDEYLRFVKMNEDKLKQERRERENNEKEP